MAKLPYNKIPRYIGRGSYEVHMPWAHLDQSLESLGHGVGLDLNPPYQRGHVWTEAQQKAYFEFIVCGGDSAKVLMFNCPDWPRSRKDSGPIELVDGKQRLTAVLKFVHDELTIFDSNPEIGPTLCSELEVLRITELRFTIYVNHLMTRAEVLDWYLQINDGGTPHTQQELDKVRRMREEAREQEAWKCDICGLYVPEHTTDGVTGHPRHDTCITF